MCCVLLVKCNVSHNLIISRKRPLSGGMNIANICVYIHIYIHIYIYVWLIEFIGLIGLIGLIWFNLINPINPMNPKTVVSRALLARQDPTPDT